MKRVVRLPIAWLILSFAFWGGKALPAAALSQSATPAPSEGWTKTWGGSSDELNHNVAVDRWGNLYVIGEFVGTVDFDPSPTATDFHASHNGTIDAFLSKFTPDGIFLWARTWGGGPLGGTGHTGRDVANGVDTDEAGNVYVTGPYQYTVDFGAGATITSNTPGATNNIYLAKYSPNGTFQWVRAWGPADGGAESYNLLVDQADKIYVVGDFSGTTVNFNPWDPFHPDWHVNHPPYSGPAFDAFLSKFDANGNFIWARTWGGNGYDDGPGLAVDGAGNTYVGGMYASTDIDFDPGPAVVIRPAHDQGFIVDVFLSKFDANGNFVWVRTWGGQDKDDAGGTVAVDGADNVYVGGRFGSLDCDFNPLGTADYHSSHGDLDAFISKFDANGAFQWAKTWGGSGWDATGDLAVDAWNNVYASGMFSDTVDFNPDPLITDMHTSASSKWDASFSKLAPDGAFQWAKTWGGSGTDGSYSLTLDSRGAAYLVGWFSNTVDFDPGGAGDNRNSNGQADAFLTQYLPALWPDIVFLPQVSR